MHNVHQAVHLQRDSFICYVSGDILAYSVNVLSRLTQIDVKNWHMSGGRMSVRPLTPNSVKIIYILNWLTDFGILDKKH